MYLAPCENVLYMWASCRLTKAASLILCGSNDVNWGQSRQVAQADTKRHERNAQETIAGQDNYTWRRSPAEDEIGSVVSLRNSSTRFIHVNKVENSFKMCKRNKKGRKTDKESFPLFQKKRKKVRRNNSQTQGKPTLTLIKVVCVSLRRGFFFGVFFACVS